MNHKMAQLAGFGAPGKPSYPTNKTMLALRGLLHIFGAWPMCCLAALCDAHLRPPLLLRAAVMGGMGYWCLGLATILALVGQILMIVEPR